MLAVLFLLAPPLARCQVTGETPAVTSTIVEANPSGVTTTGVTKETSDKRPAESEIAVMGMIPLGDYRMFSATVRCNAWTAGVEYDRPSWGYFLKARVDYVAEVLPLLLLNEPSKADFWGNALTPNQQLLPGVSISPFGFRTMWRSNKAIKPYVISKIGIAVFTRKALSPKASYANFNVQADFGLQVRLTDRVELRVDPFSFFHISNGYLAASNPGMDELATKIGISYHLRNRRE